MHLYVIRQPDADRVWHLHPEMTSSGVFTHDLPPIPAGRYKLYGDVVHRSGFPETMVADLTLRSRHRRHADLRRRRSGLAAPSPDGAHIVWDRGRRRHQSPQPPFFKFRLVDKNGAPVPDMELYMGMLGHAAFVKNDGTVFAHVHPSGSVPMAALALANPSARGSQHASHGQPARRSRFSLRISQPRRLPHHRPDETRRRRRDGDLRREGGIAHLAFHIRGSNEKDAGLPMRILFEIPVRGIQKIISLLAESEPTERSAPGTCRISPNPIHALRRIRDRCLPASLRGAPSHPTVTIFTSSGISAGTAASGIGRNAPSSSSQKTPSPRGASDSDAYARQVPDFMPASGELQTAQAKIMPPRRRRASETRQILINYTCRIGSGPESHQPGWRRSRCPAEKTELPYQEPNEAS